MIDRRRVNEAAVARILTQRRSSRGLQFFRDVRDGDPGRRRAHVLHPPVRAEIGAETRRALWGRRTQGVEPGLEQRRLPRVEPVRARVDVLGEAALETGGRKAGKGVERLTHLPEIGSFIHHHDAGRHQVVGEGNLTPGARNADRRHWCTHQLPAAQIATLTNIVKRLRRHRYRRVVAPRLQPFDSGLMQLEQERVTQLEVEKRCRHGRSPEVLRRECVERRRVAQPTEIVLVCYRLVLAHSRSL